MAFWPHLGRLVGAILGALAYDVLLVVRAWRNPRARDRRYMSFSRLRVCLLGAVAIGGFGLVEISPSPDIDDRIAIGVLGFLVIAIFAHAVVIMRDFSPKRPKYPWEE